MQTWCDTGWVSQLGTAQLTLWRVQLGCSSLPAMYVGGMLKESGYSKLSSVITPQIKTWHRACLSAAAGHREGSGRGQWEIWQSCRTVHTDSAQK